MVHAVPGNAQGGFQIGMPRIAGFLFCGCPSPEHCRPAGDVNCLGSSQDNGEGVAVQLPEQLGKLRPIEGQLATLFPIDLGK